MHESANGGVKKFSKAVGCTKDGLNTKIHTLTDALGEPLEFLLTPGNVHDSTVAVELLSCHDLFKSNTLNPWNCDWHIYKDRHMIESFSKNFNGFTELLLVLQAR